MRHSDSSVWRRRWDVRPPDFIPMSFDVQPEWTAPARALALGLAAALLAIDLLAWRVVAAMFDRERLVTSWSG